MSTGTATHPKCPERALGAGASHKEVNQHEEDWDLSVALCRGDTSNLAHTKLSTERFVLDCKY